METIEQCIFMKYKQKPIVGSSEKASSIKFWDQNCNLKVFSYFKLSVVFKNALLFDKTKVFVVN
jgi:hypothetical protein